MSCVIVLVFHAGFLANSQTFRVSLASFHTEVANHCIQLSIKEVPHSMTIFQGKVMQFGILQFSDAIAHNSHSGINTLQLSTTCSCLIVCGNVRVQRLKLDVVSWNHLFL